MSKHVGLVNFDDMTIGVMQKDLVPTRNGPASVVRITDTYGVALAHETLDVIGAETEMAMSHRVDELLHLVSGVEVALSPVKLDVTVGEEVDLAGVSTVIAIAADDGVRLIFDGAQLKQRLVELRQTGEVIRAEVHVMKLELHSDLAFVEVVKLSPRYETYPARSMDEQASCSTMTKRYQYSPVKSMMHL